jgi:Cu(I)/Ag(I) efflux system membrane fusion protein
VNRNQLVIVLLVVTLVALGAGYWLGRGHGPEAGEAAATALADGADAASGERKILYYRNPMGLSDTSPVPKKDSMGMDYIPVYEGDEPDGPQVKISLSKLQKLGVRTEEATARSMVRTIRAVGTIQPSERGLYTISPRFEGWITKLHVNTTGERVRRGQPLLEVYSPDLVTAQEEYRTAWTSLQAMGNASSEAQADMRLLAEGALRRLANWQISEADLAGLRQGKAAQQSLVLRSPADGVVLEKAAIDGMRFMPGEVLFEIADLSKVWIIANVFEQDLGAVRPGQAAKVSLAAYPARTFEGSVTFVYPTVRAETRTGQVRIELPNRDGLLKPDLYGTVDIQAGEAAASVAIPESAVLDSGTRQVALVELGPGLFEPREIRIGGRGDGYVEVLEGIGEGERVVVDGNFLIDAESNFKAALGAMSGHSGHGGSSPPSEQTGSNEAAPVEGAPPATTAPEHEHAGH